MRPRAWFAIAWVVSMYYPAVATERIDSESTAVIESRPDAVVRALEAAILLSGQEGGDIRLATWNGLFERDDAGAWVVLVVEVDGPALLKDTQEGELAVDLHLYALGSDQEVVATVSRQVVVDLVEHRSRIELGGLKVPMLLALPDGDHLLRLLVRTGEKAFGIRSIQTSVDAEVFQRLTFLPPVFPDPTGGWLIASPGSPESASTPDWLPFVNGNGKSLPAALPVVRRGDTPRGTLYLIDSSPRPTNLEIVLRPAFAETTVGFPLTVLGRVPSTSPKLDALGFEWPEVDLPTGVYTAVIDLNPGTDASTSTPTFNLVVAAEGNDSLWPNLDLETTDRDPERAIAGVDGLPPAYSDDEFRALGDKELIQGYQQVLATLVEHGFAVAGGQLRSLEEQAAKAPVGSTLQRLEEAEIQTSAALAERGADLLPVVTLHALSASTYRAEGEGVLASHSLRLVLRLARLAFHPPQTDLSSRSAIANLLSEVAAGEAAYGNLTQAVSLFEGALEASNADSEALLGLASVYERLGRYGEAAETLKGLWDRNPDLAEAGLRLGINLARRSQTKRARSVLSQVATISTEAWVSRLAFQELARLELEREQPLRAIEVLRQGLEDWPQDFHLRVQLAYCLESVGRTQEAKGVLLSLQPSTLCVGSPSARWLYHRLPGLDSTDNLQALASLSRKDLPGIQAALEDLGPIVTRQ